MLQLRELSMLFAPLTKLLEKVPHERTSTKMKSLNDFTQVQITQLGRSHNFRFVFFLGKNNIFCIFKNFDQSGFPCKACTLCCFAKFQNKRLLFETLGESYRRYFWRDETLVFVNKHRQL